jgi:hypothetical protein
MTRWHDALGQSGRASAGWETTLEAVSDGRVDTLLYAPGAAQDVWRCPSCRRLEPGGGECPVDGAELEQCADGLDAVVHRTLAFGGHAHEIPTRPDLGPVGGIGAMLRF